MKSHKHNFVVKETIPGGLFTANKYIYECRDRFEPRGQETKVFERDEKGRAIAVGISQPTHYELVEEGCGELRSF